MSTTELDSNVQGSTSNRMATLLVLLASSLVLIGPISGLSPPNKYHGHWLGSSGNIEESSNENDINFISGMGPESSHKPAGAQQYVCGRPMAMQRFRESSGSRSSSMSAGSGSMHRNKYRPIEIRMPRIIGGYETRPGEFPWTASVKLNGQPICGGSLIDRSWVLTAAHCVVGYNPKNLTVRLGAYKVKDLAESQTVDLPVTMFVVHREYSMPRPFSNDIALLKLAEPVSYTDYIIPICLPTEDLPSKASQPLADTQYSPATPESHSNNNININSDNNHYGHDNKNNDNDETGIVVSTKMSDKEIAKCFKKLEQNYLTSIGLGSPTSAADTSQATETPAPTASPTGHSKLASGGTSSAGYNNLAAYDSALLMASQHSNNNNNNMNFNKYNAIVQNQLHNQQHHYDMSQYNNNNNNNPYTNGLGHPSEYYNIHWKLDNTNKNTDTDKLEGRQNHNHNLNHQHLEQLMALGPNSQIKLSRLPISKELIREIQSMGTGQLQSLSFNLHHGDIVSMASDLIKGSGDGHHQSQHDNTTPQQQHYPQIAMSNHVGPYREKVTSSSVSIAESVQDHDQDPPNPADPQLTNINSNMDDASDDPTGYSGLSGTVVGWGWLRELDGDEQPGSKGNPSATLQKVKLPILRNKVCEAWFQSQSKKITLLPSQFCAGFSSGGKDACRGDSGGPMIIEDDSDTGRYKLIGIVSAGIGCARPSLPGLYTRVASFIPWINAQIDRY